ncbi:MAG: adenine phosphoribosyltransferase, partial [Candidatus Pacearchaeota archaeon]
IEELRCAKIIEKGDYKYILNSITEQEPPLDPLILEDFCNRLLRKLDFKNATKIVTAEAMGISLATLISVKTGIPLVIATRRSKDLKTEECVKFRTGYMADIMHLNKMSKKDRIVIIDDLISTAGTIVGLIKAITKNGAKVVDIGVVFNKPDYKGVKLLRKIGYDPKYLLDVKIKNDKVFVQKIK